ncbi:MAG: glycosyltransferase [Clostridiales Family XIII bacterium]|jgi:UDP:flavonoid glycosyltransferase YjiC (YdhE family)|nr:glycosyltransferase [Clostridiales Family XIII bacterium]
MKIAILTMGTRGDTQPFISLAVYLQSLGHDVVLGARPDFVALAKEYGVPFAPLGHSYASFIKDNTKNFEKGDFFKIALQGLRQYKIMFENMGEDAFRAALGSDAIIYKHSWLAGYSIAEKLGVPCASAMLFPITKTKEFPCFMLGEGKDRGRLGNALYWRLCEQIVTWQFQRPADNKLRRKTLGLKSAPFFGYGKRQEREKMPVFYSYSSYVLPKPSDWPENIHVTGIWKNPLPADWSPPPALTRFLENGEPPVYIGFGSMPSSADKTLTLILKALEISKRRAVLLSGWAGVGSGITLPDTVFCVDGVPHSWLFPKCAAVVHHGGAGTTMAGLLGGAPSIITPSTIDQHSWARQIHKLGTGPAPIPFKNLSAENLSTAIAGTTTDKTMQKRAAEVRAVLEREDGIKAAADLFFEYVGRA